MEGILAAIFAGFGSALGGKLGGKIEPRSKEKCLQNMMQNKSRLERLLDWFWLPTCLLKPSQERLSAAPFFALNIGFVCEGVF